MPLEAVKTFPQLFEVDRNLNHLVREMEFLHYLNPMNTDQEKKRFFSSKFSENPVFKYRKLRFDPYEMQRLIFNLSVEKIEDPEIRKLYEEIVYEYSTLIQCMQNIGQGKRFYYNCLKVFGTPKERDVDNARFILHFADEDNPDILLPRFTADEAESYLRAFGAQYEFIFNIRQSPHISAASMVLHGSETLVLKKNYLFSEQELRVLSHHEIGLHMVSTFNGKQQPLKIFSNGLVNNTETQEGLAVFSEYMSGSLTLKRLKEFAYRVIAADSLIKGYDFADTFDLLFSQYKLNRDTAWQITLRAHRGGGFTKDYVYLSGLKKIYDLYRSGGDYELLLGGKIGLEQMDIVLKLINMGLALPNVFNSISLEKNRNQNQKLNFILDNLK